MDEKKQFQGTKPYVGPTLTEAANSDDTNSPVVPTEAAEEPAKEVEDEEDADVPAVKWTQELDAFWKKIVENVVNSVSWRKIINLIRCMVSMGQRWVIICNQAFESEISLDRGHTIGYNDKVEPAIAYIERNKKITKFSDDKFYKFTKVKDILEEYFFNLWNIKL